MLTCGDPEFCNFSLISISLFYHIIILFGPEPEICFLGSKSDLYLYLLFLAQLLWIYFIRIFQVQQEMSVDEFGNLSSSSFPSQIPTIAMSFSRLDLLISQDIKMAIFQVLTPFGLQLIHKIGNSVQPPISTHGLPTRRCLLCSLSTAFRLLLSVSCTECMAVVC